jgi:hypothetical protein
VRPWPAVLALLALAACAAPPPPAPTATGTRDVAAEAAAAFDRQDWATAAPLFRQLAGAEPDRLRWRYGLAVCAAHLGLEDEAVREFEWVLAHAAAAATEARVAREWLAAARSRRAPTAASEAERRREHIGDSTVAGRVSWTGDSPVPTSRLQLFLNGLPRTDTAGLQFVRRTDADGRFEFRGIPSGAYVITNRIAGEPIWRLRVEAPAGQAVAVDLSDANSVKVRDDFPER